MKNKIITQFDVNLNFNQEQLFIESITKWAKYNKSEQPSQSNVSEDVLYKTLVNKITGEFIAILNNEFYISDTPIIQPITATIDLMKEMFNELPFEGKELVNVIIKITG